MNKGILYVSTGKEFVDETILSAKTVKQEMDVPITVASDESIESEFIDSTIKIDNPQYGFGDQIDIMKETPYDKTLYLDSDIYMCEGISDIFTALDHFDLVASHAPVRSQDDNSDVQRPPPCFPEYNTGVVGYCLTDLMHTFLNRWAEEYEKDHQRGCNRNQPSFRQALYESDIRIGTLPSEYNCRFQFPGQATGIVKVFHGRLREMNTNNGGAPHLMDIKSVANKINKKQDPRVFYPRGNSVSVRGLSDSILYRLQYSLKQHGVLKTMKQLMRKL
jgi:hypothetical protein